MFGKKKELEAAIEELKAKLSEQEALNARLEQAIEEYKRKEGAIANALTRAQSDAGKGIDEANAEGARIINKANEDKAAAHAEAESIIAKPISCVKLLRIIFLMRRIWLNFSKRYLFSGSKKQPVSFETDCFSFCLLFMPLQNIR